jgi:hypothetical protein
VAITEPVVLHHGREGGGFTSRRGAAVRCNGLLGGTRNRAWRSCLGSAVYSALVRLPFRKEWRRWIHAWHDAATSE